MRKEITVPAIVEVTGEIARIVLYGDIDFAIQENLGNAIDQALSVEPSKEIQVDMTNATFIDSSVIRSLLKLQERAHAKGKSISIWNCNDHIREIFGIGGFDQMFVIH
jgi:HptB-dependent secretion and biofilm anti anti-sigma factor